MSSNYGDSSDAVRGASQPATSLDVLVRCPHCPQARFFKGERGLKVHLGRKHKPHNVPSTCPTIPTPLTPESPPQPFWKILSKFKSSTPVLKRVPRGARPSVASNLARCLGTAVNFPV
ncbi:hypothetical protein PYW08_002181 [Mythimna loreyi]|uniref:Uncharacterized protein n=1 Tax=Mythimna loreyi TaxID=667449 RepID=A0ACC2R196_9NEOP|nr:hypothetical protein PYW08_002181 [Mythimna loreyi]